MAHHLLKGTVSLTVGNALGYGLSFVRNLVIARMLSKADYGLAAVFAMTVTLLEMTSKMSLGQQIVQDKEGECPRFMATAHSFQLSVGLLSGVLLVAVCYPAGKLFGVPHLAWAFACLAVIPLAKGAEHLDYFRRQRVLNFTPAILCELVPQLLVTLAAYPLALWLKDFRVIIWIMLLKAVLTTLFSHLLAEQRISYGWEKRYVGTIWGFAWPLLANGFLMFFSQQADQFAVASFLTLGDVAIYSLAFTLASLPWFLFGQVSSSLMLPLLSAVQDDPPRFKANYRICADLSAVASIFLTLPLIVAGEQVVTLLYGQKYSGAGPVLAILGVTSAVRFLRFVPAVCAMSKADTGNLLFSNLWRAGSLPIVLVVAFLGGGATEIAVSALVGELMATGASFWRLRSRQNIPLSASIPALGYVGFFSVMAMFVGWFAGKWSFVVVAAVVMAGFLGAGAAGYIFFPRAVEAAKSILGRKVIPHPQPMPATTGD